MKKLTTYFTKMYCTKTMIISEAKTEDGLLDGKDLWEINSGLVT